MVMQGIQGNLFELLASPDKSVRDFMSTIKTGDTLRGRVIDIIANENKAIINFKGYNLVSQLPRENSIQKGDFINVEVSQLGEKIMMKLAPGPAAIGKGAEVQQGTQTQTLQQTADMLAAIKVPVNEHNIFIARKLADYHIPVTKQNISEINVALNRYMADKGIDASSFRGAGAETKQPGIPREMVFVNALKISAEAAKAAASLKAGGMTDDQAAVLKQTASAGIMHMANTLNIAAKSSGAVNIGNTGANTVITISNTPPETAAALIKTAVLDGIIKPAEARVIQNNIASGNSSSAGIMNNSASVSYSENTLTVSLNNIADNLASVIPRPQGMQVSPELLSAKVFEPPAANRGGAESAPQVRPGAGNTPQAGQSAGSTAQTQIQQAVTILTANDTAVQQGVSRIIDSASMLARMSAGNPDPAGAKEAGRLINTIQQEAGRLPARIDAALESMPVINPKDGARIKEFSAKIVDFINTRMSENQAVSKAFQGVNLTAAENTAVRETAAALANMINNSLLARNSSAPVQAGAKAAAFDIEAAIESLAFLKSRGIPAENTKIIDVMNRYFSNDMKMNQNIEQLNAAIREFGASAGQAANSPGPLRNLSNMLAALSTAIEQASIKTETRSLTGANMENQIKNFIENSGMNIENRLKNMLINRLDAAAGAKNAGSAARTESLEQMSMNVKSQLLKAEAEIQKLETANLTNIQRENTARVGEAIRDLLNNMNAVQFINQKPAAFDMIYTQLPLFFENKYFNGEMQVWYRKGNLKDAFENALPVNMVFVLNTSKLGSIRINMTVYKNEIETIIKTETPEAKQLLMKNKNDFLNSVRDAEFNMRAFNVIVDSLQGEEQSPEADGYINLGNINLRA